MKRKRIYWLLGASLCAVLAVCALFLCSGSKELRNVSTLIHPGSSAHWPEDNPDNIVSLAAEEMGRNFVVEITILGRRQIETYYTRSGMRYRYLVYVHQVHLGKTEAAREGLHAGKMLWLEGWQDEMAIGGRYFTAVRCWDYVLYGKVFSTGDPMFTDYNRYWRVRTFGELEPVSWLQAKKSYSAATDPENLREDLKSYALPTTRQEMLAYLAALDARDWDAISPKRRFAVRRIRYLKHNTLRQAVEFSHVVVRAEVIEAYSPDPEYPDSRGGPMRATIRFATEDVLKGTTLLRDGTHRDIIKLELYPGQVEEGKEYLFLLRGHDSYETDPEHYGGDFALVARNHAVIPVTRGAKVARVYRMLGLEMPEE